MVEISCQLVSVHITREYCITVILSDSRCRLLSPTSSPFRWFLVMALVLKPILMKCLMTPKRFRLIIRKNRGREPPTSRPWRRRVPRFAPGRLTERLVRRKRWFRESSLPSPFLENTLPPFLRRWVTVVRRRSVFLLLIRPRRPRRLGRSVVNDGRLV